MFLWWASSSSKCFVTDLSTVRTRMISSYLHGQNLQSKGPLEEFTDISIWTSFLCTMRMCSFISVWLFNASFLLKLLFQILHLFRFIHAFLMCSLRSVSVRSAISHMEQNDSSIKFASFNKGTVYWMSWWFQYYRLQ